MAVLAAAVILPLALFWLVNARARTLHQEALRQSADDIASYLHREPGGQIKLDLPERLRALYGTEYGRYSFAVVTADNTRLFGAQWLPALFPSHPRTSATDYAERRVNGARVFAARIPVQIGGTPLWIDLVEDQAHRDVLIDDIVAEFLPGAALIVIPILLVLLAADLLIFERALRPLMRASWRAAQIGPRRTDIRLPEQGIPRELRALVRSVNEALDRLEEGITRQREFVADAAHELRTPLAVLRARAEALGDTGEARTLIADIDAMARIVSQLLDAADSEGLGVDDGEAIDLATLAASVAAFVAPVAVTQGKQVAVDAAAASVPVIGNEPALFRAIRNLVENAIRYTPKGTTVEIAVGRDGTLTVSDRGPGIPPADREQIFKRFWRADRSRHGSAGLGLAIVERIAQAHGGSIGVSDNPGGGAVFTLRLRPAMVDESLQTGSIPAHEPPPARSPRRLSLVSRHHDALDGQ